MCLELTMLRIHFLRTALDVESRHVYRFQVEIDNLVEEWQTRYSSLLRFASQHCREEVSRLPSKCPYFLLTKVRQLARGNAMAEWLQHVFTCEANAHWPCILREALRKGLDACEVSLQDVKMREIAGRQAGIVLAARESLLQITPPQWVDCDHTDNEYGAREVAPEALTQIMEFVQTYDETANFEVEAVDDTGLIIPLVTPTI